MKFLIQIQFCAILIIINSCTTENHGDELSRGSGWRLLRPGEVVAEQIGNIEDSSLMWVLYDTISPIHFAYGGNRAFILEGGAWDSSMGSNLIIEGISDYESIIILLSDTIVFQQSDDHIPSHTGIILPRARVDLTNNYREHRVTLMINGVWRKFTWNNELYKNVRVVVHDGVFNVVYSNQWPTYK